MFPGSVPKRSMIFPWQMVKKIPKACKRRRGQEQTGAELLGSQTDHEPLSLTCTEQLRRPEEVPSDSGYVSSTANSKPRGR